MSKVSSHLADVAANLHTNIVNDVPKLKRGQVWCHNASTLHLGYEVGSGEAVEIPLKHLAITGQTQEAGKTTALEALIDRSKLTAVTFITKRGEGSFTEARRIDPYFREQADWQFVASILEASRSEKLKFERAWIIRASRGARTLADVQRNVQKAMETAKGMSADVYLTLDAYLDAVVPQIATVRWATKLELKPGVNVVDLTHLNIEMQHLVIKSTITWVLERESNTVVVVPEAWKFIPQGRGTPVKLAAESFIRQAAASGNYLWIDSQDIAGVEKIILKSVPVWILGVQREWNEIKRTLSNIPAGLKKPKPDDIATLELGEFYACWGKHSIKTYVQPRWLPERVAQQIAQTGDRRVISKYAQPKKGKSMAIDERLADLERENRELKEENRQLREKVSQPITRAPFPPTIPDRSPLLTGTPSAPTPEGRTIRTGPVQIEAIEREVEINFSQEKRVFTTTGPRGMIMFVLVHDLKNGPALQAEIGEVMAERGWNYGNNTLAPELAKLVKNGDLIREGQTKGVRYRLPGKLKISIDGNDAR